MKNPIGTIAQRCAAGASRPAPSRRAWLALLVATGLAAQTPEPPAPPAGAPAATDAAAPSTTPAAPGTEAVAAPVPATADTALARREAAQQTFLRLTDEKRYEEAVAIATQIVDLSRQIYGEASIEIAAPLVNLATAQVQKGDLGGAETNYKAAIAIIEREDGLVSPRLVNPLVGLGETYVRGGLYPQAADAYVRALRVNHAESGFYNLEQMRILDGLTEAFLGLDKLPQANAQQRTQVAIQQRRAGDDSPELVAALEKLGRWYNRTGQYPEAREAYQYARRVIRETGSDSDPAMVDSLLGEALTYENEGAIPAAASTLKRALDILEAQPEKDHLKRAEVLVALGDLYTLTRQFKSAGQRYGQAWQDLSGDDALLAQRDAYFARPSRISGPRLPQYVGEDGKDKGSLSGMSGTFADGLVVATMTVSATGEAVDPTIIESDPPGLLDKKVVRTLESTAFRPKLEDGVAAASEGVQFRHEFRYQRATPKKSDGTPAPIENKGERIDYPPDEADEPDGQKKP